jgi:putative NIF3 family GTP cyclohydrolase 1 type 2
MATPAQIILRTFERIAPLKLAEKWDNVGPHAGISPREVTKADKRFF